VQFEDATRDRDDDDRDIDSAWLPAVPRVGDIVRLPPDHDRRWKVAWVEWSIEPTSSSGINGAIIGCHVKPLDPKTREEADELQDLVRRCITVFEKAMENGQVQFKIEDADV
jgi:hypothetical protein